MVIIAGVAEPLAGTAYAAMLVEMYPDRARAGAMSRAKIEGMLATIVATMVAGQVMAGQHDYRLVFPVAAFIGLSGVLVFSRIQSGAVQKVTPLSTWYSVGILGRDEKFRSFSIAFFLAGAGHLIAKTAYPLVLVDVVHASNFQVAALAAAAQVVQLGAYFFWGRWIDAHTPAQALVRGFALLAGASLVYLAPCTPWLSSNPTAWLLLPAAVLLGVGSGATELASVNCLFQLAPEGRAARYVSVHKGLVGIRGSLAPFVAVQLMHLAGWAGAFLTSVGLTMLGAVLLSRVSSALFVAEQAGQAPQEPRVAVE
jgi:Na+/melibiose symporter-like transporter